MKTCEQFVAVAMDSGVAHNLMNDLISLARKRGDKLVYKDSIKTVTQIRERLQAATSCMIEIERKMHQHHANENPKS